MYEEEFSQIASAAMNQSLTFFVGAGISALSGAPTWRALIDDIAKQLGVDYEKSDSNEYLKLAQMFFYSLPPKSRISNYYEFIWKHLNTAKCIPNSMHKALLSFHPASFITTNFDDLIEDAAISNCLSYKVIAEDAEVPLIHADRFILKIHGDLKHKNIVFKEEDYLNYSENFKLIETLLKSIFSTNTIVFIGYGLNDYNIKLVLNWAKNLLNDHFNKPIFIYTGRKRLSKEELLYQHSRGLQVIQSCDFVEPSENYLESYSAVINAIKSYSDTSFSGKDGIDAFDVLYRRLSPLDKLSALRICDVSSKLSPDITIEIDGGIRACDNDTYKLLKYFLDIFQATRIEHKPVPSDIMSKFDVICSVFKKARIHYLMTEEKIIYLAYQSELPLADPICTSYNYKQMCSFVEKSYTKMSDEYKKAFYSVKLGKIDQAINLFSLVAKKSFKSRDYLLYYFASVNSAILWNCVKNNHYFAYNGDTIYTDLLNNEKMESIFTRLPIDFQTEYDSLKDVCTPDLLYRYAYVSSYKAHKLKERIEKNSLEIGRTSCDEVICCINDYLHFLQGNGLIIDMYDEYKYSINELMSNLLYKYSAHGKRHLWDPLKSDRLDGKIVLDEIDFYCFVEYFTYDNLANLLSNYRIHNLEFRNVEKIEIAVRNVIKYYSTQSKTFNLFGLITFQRKIKNILKLLEYIDISQSLVDEICDFLLSQEFREILIDKKIRFLNAQLHKRGKISKVTAAVIEKQLLNYLDQHIQALKYGTSFNVYSESSAYSYYDLVRFISPEGIPVVSRKISLRVGLIIDNELTSMYRFITDYYWDNISVYMRRKAKEKLTHDLQESFSFEQFVSLINIGVKINAETIDNLKKYLWDQICEERNNNNAGIRINTGEEKLHELIQVGYFCLSGVLPHDQFNEYLGIIDEFDFAYEYDNFDFSKFDVAWLIGLTPHGLRNVCRNKTVKKEIQKLLADAIRKNEIASGDAKKLTNILIKYFL